MPTIIDIVAYVLLTRKGLDLLTHLQTFLMFNPFNSFAPSIIMKESPSKAIKPTRMYLRGLIDVYTASNPIITKLEANYSEICV